MSQFHVIIPDVEALSSTTSETADIMEGQIGQLRSAVGGVLGSTWVGQDATTFSGAFQSWLTAAQETQSALAAIGQLLQQSGNKYGTTEQAIVSQLNAAIQALIPDTEQVNQLATDVQQDTRGSQPTTGPIAVTGPVSGGPALPNNPPLRFPT
jgi:WXG100 family type VII secretion target